MAAKAIAASVSLLLLGGCATSLTPSESGALTGVASPWSTVLIKRDLRPSGSAAPQSSPQGANPQPPN